MNVSVKSNRVILETTNCAPVVIVGSVAYDTIVTSKRTEERVLGGAASYASVSASHFTDVQLVGVVGNDFKQTDLETFKDHGIDLQGLTVDNSLKTFFWKGAYNDSFTKRETLLTELNAFENFNPILPKAYQSSPFVMLGNISPVLQKNVLSQLKQTKFTMADTIEFWIHSMKNEILDIISKVDMFVIDQSEAELITNESNFITAGKKILQMGCNMVIIKHGEHGSTLFHPEGLFRASTYPTESVIDPTGAGDTYAGALIGYLAATNDTSFKSIKNAMLYASATASITVESFGFEKLRQNGSKEIMVRYERLCNLTNPN